MPILRSVQDTEYASWPIIAPATVTLANDTAQVAFVRRKYDTPTTWYPATIVTDATLYGDSRPRLRVLIGPANGGIKLDSGTWHVWGKITDAPEVPVKYLDYLVLR